MGWFIFRLGVRFKDLGERLNFGGLIRLGLSIKGFVIKHGRVENGKIRIW